MATDAPAPLPIDDVLFSDPVPTQVRGPVRRWAVSNPAEGRRTSLWELDGSEPRCLTPAPFDARSRVMEYGGGAWDVADQASRTLWVAVDDARRQVVTFDGSGDAVPLTPRSDQVHFGGLSLDLRRHLVLAVREDHRGEGEPVTTIVALRLGAPNEDFGTVLVAGADFVAGPRLSEDGRLAWFEWNHPHMPWDRSAIKVGRLDDSEGYLRLVDVVTVVDAEEVSAQHPQWDADQLYFTSDESGFWNLRRWDGRTVHRVTDSDHDHDHPVWTLDRPTWAVQAGRVACHRLVDGWPQLLIVADGSGTVFEVPGLTEVESVAFDAEGAAMVFGHFADAEPKLLVLHPDGSHEVLQAQMPEDGPSLGRTRSITVEGPAGPVQAWLHLPLQAERGLPLIVKSHGGPTSCALGSRQASVDFWTSRGFAVVDVNYSGSTGFGRAYRNRLRGQWGVVDVADCAAVVDHLVAEGIVDASRVAITGGSAGGYCTLQSLVTTDRYTAGVSRYGIGDLEVLATDTHKFESRYLDSLVGPYPAAKQVYLDRSPVHHVDQLSTPMLILQGLDDLVVPPNQATAMAEAVRAKGLEVELRTYRGEGHGFRGLDARRDALQAELDFYVRLWSLDL